MSRLFYLLLTAHFLGDFVFQSNDMVLNKKQNYPERLRPIAEHVLRFFVISLLLYLLDCYFLLGTFSLPTIFIITLICLLHGVIDNFKPLLHDKLEGKLKEVATFSLDQLVHFLSIVIVLFFYYHENRYTWLDVLRPQGAAAFFASCACLLFSTMFGAYFIRIFLQSIDLKPMKKENDQLIHLKGQESFGFMIGLVERGLIFLFVMVDAFSGVATVIAVKSLARFKEIENNREFAEYYLIGNLLSLFFGLIGALILRFLLG